jgi:hypothetical protein
MSGCHNESLTICDCLAVIRVLEEDLNEAVESQASNVRGWRKCQRSRRRLCHGSRPSAGVLRLSRDTSYGGEKNSDLPESHHSE